jgi:uncharacterized surface protein with fasciclin (FAS1) repeats
MNTFTKLSSGAFALALFIGLNAPAVQAADVVKAAGQIDELSTLVALVGGVDGLADTLATTDNITVFAPTNDAFAKMPRVLNRAIERNPDILVSILTYHVAGDRLRAADVVGMRSIPTLEGSSINVRTAGSNVFLNNARITAVDIETSNATVHTINNVLIPWHSILRDVIAALRHGA